MDRIAVSEEVAIHDEVRASESREWQLWYLTIGLLVLFGSGALAGFYLLLELEFGDAGPSQVAFRLLLGLAVLTVLFCAYIVHARMNVSRVKFLLNEMSGMATANMELHDCLVAIARGLARTYRAPIARILILRANEPAIELASTHVADGRAAEPADGYSREMAALGLLRRAAESPEPLVVDRELLRTLPESDPQRTLLTGGFDDIDMALVLPLWTPRRRVGFVVLGVSHPFWARTLHPRMIATLTTLARHAGTVIEESIRRRESIRDPLTELYNRRHFKERIREEIARSTRDGQILAVLLCDLDRFKQVNDTRGHPFGDQVLKAVATAIRGATRGTDLHFRWGGDEIIVVLSKTSEEGVLIAAERIRWAVREYAESEGIDLDVSIGIALCPQHGSAEEDLVRAADLAMYVAKKSGDRVRVGIDEYSIDERCVTFVYQPILSVANGGTLGHEVFTRDPGGNLSPLDLFKKYHAVGQLGRLKRLIFELQVRQAREAGVRRLFVNSDLDFLLRTDPVHVPEGLEVIVEISEIDRDTRAEDRISAFRKWRRAGYGLAIDDFGAGYVSLPVLSQLKPDYVKIDRSSIVHAVESIKYREFLRHLLRAAGEFAPGGIVAEGIERDAELEVAKDLGVLHVQGFLFGRPAPVASDGRAALIHEAGPAEA